LGYIDAGETSGRLAAAWTCPRKQLCVTRTESSKNGWCLAASRCVAAMLLDR
jgi:hypothetical protein